MMKKRSLLRSAGVLLAGVLLATVAVADEPRQHPPSDDELRKPRALIAELFPIAEDAKPDQIKIAISGLQDVANIPSTPPRDLFAISAKVEELAIRIGDAELWQSTIDARLDRFELDRWVTNTNGLVRFAKDNGRSFADSVLVERALRIAQQRSDDGHASEAVLFLQAVVNASSDLAVHRNVAERFGAAITLLKERQAQDSAYSLAKAALEKNPEDGHANFVTGAYLAVVERDWKNALAAFAKSDESAFERAAKMELDSNDLDAIAEVWGAVATSYTRQFRQTNSLSDAVIEHAIELKKQVSANADLLKQRKYAADIAALEKGLRAPVLKTRTGSTTSTADAPATRVRSSNSESRPMKRIRLARERAAPDAVKIGDHYYKPFSKPKIPWPIAAEECARMGGYLACMESEDERQSVVAALDKPLVLWLGGRVAPNGKPIWINGAAVTQSVMDLKRGYKYVAFTIDGALNVRPKSGNAPYHVKSIKGYLCEWDH
jgi:hypothetical protein